MTQCSCPFRQWNQVVVLSLGQQLGSIKQKSRYNSDFEWNNVLVPRHPLKLVNPIALVVNLRLLHKQKMKIKLLLKS